MANFPNQPMGVIVLSLVAVYIWACLGDVQTRLRELNIFYNQYHSFSVTTATEDEIKARGIKRGLRDPEIDILIKFYRRNWTIQQIANEQHKEYSTIKNQKKALKAKLEDKG